MNFNEFQIINYGKYKVTTQALGPQCVALMREYCRDVLGLKLWTIPAADYAYQMWERFPDAGDDNFIKIKNTLSGVPKKGDIFFFKRKSGSKILWQHVCIFISGDVYKFISYDQNWGTPRYCRYINHDYVGALGWLSPRRPNNA